MEHYIKQRIADIRRGNVPAGYKQIRRLGIYPIEWRKAKIEEFIRFYNEKSLTNNQFPVLTSSRKGLFLQKDYFEDQVTTENNVGYNIIPRGYFTYRSRSDDGAFYFNCNTIIDKGVISCFYPVFSFDKTKVDTDYIFICLNELLKEQIYCEVAGTSQSVLSEKALSGMSLIVPPLAEQKRIAEVLGCCDRGIALKKELIAEKKRQKKALMQKLLNPDNGYRLPGFAGEWNNFTLGELGRCIRGVNYNPQEDILPYRIVDSYCLLRANNFGSSEIDITDSIFVKKTCVSSVQEILPCDILISMSSGSKKAIGKTTIVKSISSRYCVGAFCAIFRSDRNAFIKHFFDSDSYQKQLSILLEGTNINNLTQEDVEGLKIKVPKDDHELQVLVNILSAADREIDLLEQELTQQQQKKKSLMQLLLTGIVRV